MFGLARAEGAVRYTIPSPYGSYRDYVDSASAQLLDLSLFRHAPHGVKARIYRDDRWLFQQWIEARRGAVATAWRSFGDTVFLQEFASRITAAGDAPVYSFLHLSVSNSSSGRRWKLDHAPAVGDPTHMVEFGTGRRAFAREA